MAERIPNSIIRGDALEALARKRPNTDGAALFWIIPARRCTQLLRLLVAYEIMSDFLDSAIERTAGEGIVNGRQLHLAMVDAIDDRRPISDYYRYHPLGGDGGYLNSLVEACRVGCASLPSYQIVRPLLIRAATLAQVQGINHEPDVHRREAVLEEWFACEIDDESELGWYEAAGAASAWLTVLALLALAAESAPSTQNVAEVYSAYFPWISLTATLLDSYGDLVEDVTNEENSYIARYDSLESAVCRTTEVILRATREAYALRNGHRHAVILASMVAMYLSKDSACTPEMKDSSRRLLSAGGPLAMLLGPVLRAWRTLYALRSA
jgi:tetraprenyl-beta-curcumene synthase